jgi:hypothetical protein
MEAVIDFLVGVSSTYPVIAGVFAILYPVSIGFKVLFTALKAYVIESPSNSDNEMVERLEKNKVFIAVKYAMDLFLRIKVK